MAATAGDGEPTLGTQAMLAEYTALRAEIDRRTDIQWRVVALQLASAGAIASVALSGTANLALLLLIPASSYLLGCRYIRHDVTGWNVTHPTRLAFVGASGL